jgi:hypothetical protein
MKIIILLLALIQSAHADCVSDKQKTSPDIPVASAIKYCDCFKRYMSRDNILKGPEYAKIFCDGLIYDELYKSKKNSKKLI